MLRYLHVEPDVRRVMQALGHTDCSTEACRCWTRRYLKDILLERKWKRLAHGVENECTEDQWVGMKFLELLHKLCGEEAKRDHGRATSGRVSSGLRVPHREG